MYSVILNTAVQMTSVIAVSPEVYPHNEKTAASRKKEASSNTDTVMTLNFIVVNTYF
jgi:hypothetical protein